MVEVNIETDFAAKNEKFIAFVDEVLNAAFDAGANDVAGLMAGELDAKRETLVQEIGENITVRRAASMEAADGFVTSYVHSDNRKAVLVELDKADEELGRDLAMHITAINPMVVDVRRGAGRCAGQGAGDLHLSGRRVRQAADIVEKMVEGRVRKFLAEVSLVDQPFVKDGNVKVGQLLKDKGNACRRFVRFEVGEGIEVEEQDFAAEVAAQVQGAE